MRKVQLTVKEDHKYIVIKGVAEGRHNKQRAAVELNLSTRQIERLVKQYYSDGKAAFRHGNAGKDPANKISTAMKNRIVYLYTTKYDGFNIRHFHEFLLQEENIKLSESTLRRILRQRRCLSPKAQRTTKRAVRRELLEKELSPKPMSQRDMKTLQDIEAVEPIKAHPSRPRKKFYGELLQMDASWEHWLGPTLPKITLHIAVDDASGIVVGANFQPQETLTGYYEVMAQILSTCGAPAEILTDRRTVFNSNKKADTPGQENPLTTFGYACQTLGTRLSVTSIPQAKGRVERMIQTFQSRLGSELRLAKVSTIEQANMFLKGFLRRFNKQFALPLEGITSVFDKQMSVSEIDRILIVARERTVSRGHTIQLENQTYQTVQDNQLVCLPPKTKLLAIRTYKGRLYATDTNDHLYDLVPLPAHEEHSLAFEVVVEAPAKPKPKRKPRKPSITHPWRLMNYRDYLMSLGMNRYEANQMAYQPSR